jgi:multiple antibiotic resistance protein
MRTFWLCFVPLFVAVDAVGILPLFISLTEGLEQGRVRRIIWQSLITGIVVALAFIAIGKVVFRLLGITIPDFMIAGGVLLFIISVTDIVTAERTMRQVDPESLGAVPVGVPLIVGPAVLTTALILVDAHGMPVTVAAAVANILIAGAVFWFAETIHHALGKAGAKAISKLASLLLAAIAVMMIRRGVQAMLGH